MSVTVLQVHKRSSYEFKYIQDKYAISADSQVFALADGTTQSFNSEIWAEIITNQFAKNPCFTPKEIIPLFKESVGQFRNCKFEYSKNPAKASLEKAKQSKGGTATFIGLRFTTERQIELIVCGDSNFFLLSSDNKIKAYPYSDLEAIDSNNNFINTEFLLQEKIDETFFYYNSFDCQLGDKIILATDALSRLIIQKPIIITELLHIENFEQLNSFCTTYWNAKELQEDDISAIILNIDKIESKKIIVPPSGFSFPRESEEEFIPSDSPPADTEIIFTDMQMNEIRNQFNGIANDFHQVKKKQKFHEMLFMIVISLLCIGLVYLIFFQNKTEKDDSISYLQQLKDKDAIIQSKQKEIDKLIKRVSTKDTVYIHKESSGIKPDTQTTVTHQSVKGKK